MAADLFRYRYSVTMRRHHAARHHLLHRRARHHMILPLVIVASAIVTSIIIVNYFVRLAQHNTSLRRSYKGYVVTRHPLGGADRRVIAWLFGFEAPLTTTGRLPPSGKGLFLLCAGRPARPAPSSGSPITTPRPPTGRCAA